MNRTPAPAIAIATPVVVNQAQANLLVNYWSAMFGTDANRDGGRILGKGKARAGDLLTTIRTVLAVRANTLPNRAQREGAEQYLAQFEREFEQAGQVKDKPRKGKGKRGASESRNAATATPAKPKPVFTDEQAARLEELEGKRAASENGRLDDEDWSELMELRKARKAAKPKSRRPRRRKKGSQDAPESSPAPAATDAAQERPAA